MTDFEQLFSVHESLSGAVSHSLREMLDTLSTGHIPSEQDTITLNDSMEKLRNNFAMIKDAAAPYLTDAAFDDELTVAQIVNRAKQCIANQLKERIDSIEETIDLFVRVQAKTRDYAEALLQYQNEAQALINDLRRNGRLTDDSAEKKIERIQLFLAAMATDDLSSDESMMVDLEESFSSKVNLGLVLKKYYLEGKGAPRTILTEKDSQLDAEKEDAEGLGPRAAAETEEPTANESEEEELPSEPALDNKKDAIKALEETDKNTVEAEGNLRTRGNANEFKSLITSKKAWDKRAAGFIFPLFTNIGAATQTQILNFGCHFDNWNEIPMEPEEFQSRLAILLDLLCKQGALVSYKLSSLKEKVYCLTPFALENLGKRFVRETMSSKWVVTFGEVNLPGKKNMDAEALRHIVNSNENLLTYFDWAKDSTNAETYALIKMSMAWQGECYKITVPWGKKRITCSMHEEFDESDYRIVVSESSVVDITPLKQNSPENVFLLSQGTLKKWSGKLKSWQSERMKAATEANKDSDAELEQLDEPRVNDGNVANERTERASETAEADPHAEVVAFPAAVEAEEVGEDGTEEEFFSLIEKSKNAKEYAMSLLDCGITPDDREAFISLVQMLVAEGKHVMDDNAAVSSISQALVLLKALSLFDDTYKDEYYRYSLALDSTIEKNNYSGDNLIRLFDLEGSENHKLLLLLSLLRALFAPSNEFDFSLRTFASQCFDEFDVYFGQYEYLKTLFNLLINLNEGEYGVFGGFTQQVLRSFSKTESKQGQISLIQKDARRLISPDSIKSIASVQMHALRPMIDLCFGKDSDLGECLAIVANDKQEDYELVKAVLDEFCDSGESSKSISAKLIDDYCDEQWKRAVAKVKSSGKQGGPRKLEGHQREKIISEIDSRLEVIETWLSMTQQNEAARKTDPRLYGLRDKIINEIESIKKQLSSSSQHFESNLILALLCKMQNKLEGNYGTHNYEFADCLRTGIFCLDENCRPIIDGIFSSYLYYEPWRNALKHIATPVENFSTILKSISDPNCKELYDNIGQAIGICDYLNQNEKQSVSAVHFSDDLENARKTSIEELKQFKGNLGLDFMYGRIQESLREELSEGADIAFEFFDEYHNYACVRSMLTSMQKIIDEDTESRKNELSSEIANKRSKALRPEQVSLLERAESELKPDRHYFVLAEEYLNRFDSGVSDPMDISNTPEDNHYLLFINEKFDELYNLCLANKKMRRIGNWGWGYTKPLLERKGFSAQYQKESQEFLEALPGSGGAVTYEKIARLLRGIGFKPNQKGSEIITPRSDDLVRLSVSVLPDSKNKTDFSHPVYIMGTEMKSPLNVICLYGWKQPADIIDKVCRKELHGTAIVFLNGALSSEQRRQLAESFHRGKNGMNSFLLIDWVLLLYLAQFEAASRLPIMLNCTLPYSSSYKPFVLKGSVSDEMFIGRKRELSQIVDPSGPVIVYGGRQLGKTALLERAQSYVDNPEKKEYSFLIRATELSSEEALVTEIINEMHQKGLAVGAATTTSGLRKELRASHKKSWKRILLLVDEADELLKSMAPKYSPIIAFSDLSHDTGNDFKFVFAGLHNVCRAANEPNTIFGQLGAPLCITPLSLPDAYELLARPLRYMGFAIDAETILKILVNTSFYPGIVHAVGYTLVENLMTRYSSFYQPAKGHPPYSLTEEQLGSVIGSDDLNDKIDERIRWTLQVDPRYFMLARCIAYLYYMEPENNKQGHSVKMIMTYADLLGIDCLGDLPTRSIVSLLKEMVDMGILVEPEENCFRLRQRRFLTAIGKTPEAIEADIEMEQEETLQ